MAAEDRWIPWLLAGLGVLLLVTLVVGWFSVRSPELEPVVIPTVAQA